jgi:hypothetical protein
MIIAHFACKKVLVKNTLEKLADLHPRQGNLLQRNNFSGDCKTSLHFTKHQEWRSAEKMISFSDMLLLA